VLADYRTGRHIFLNEARFLQLRGHHRGIVYILGILLRCLEQKQGFYLLNSSSMEKYKAIREAAANNVRGEFSKCFQVRDGRKHEYPQKADKRACSKFAAVVIVINGNHNPLPPCLRQRQSEIATEHSTTK